LLMFPPNGFSHYMKLVYYLVINAVCFFFTAGTFPLLDSMVMSKLSSNPKLSKELFGRQRLWGTVGHCVIGVFVHWLEFVIYPENKFTGATTNTMFYVLIGSSAAFVGLVFFGIDANLKVEAHKHGHGPAPPKDEKKSPNSPSADHNASAHALPAEKPSALALITNPGFTFFLLTVLVAGFIRAIITTYQSPFITEELWYDKKTVSDSIFVRVFPEVTLYFFSKELTQFFGIYWVLLIGHFAGIVRMFGYTMVPKALIKTTPLANPAGMTKGFIFALECLKGVNSSMVISSAARIASDMAPKGLASTAQGLVAGTWQGLSMTVGSAAGFFFGQIFQD